LIHYSFNPGMPI